MSAFLHASIFQFYFKSEYDVKCHIKSVMWWNEKFCHRKIGKRGKCYEWNVRVTIKIMSGPFIKSTHLIGWHERRERHWKCMQFGTWTGRPLGHNSTLKCREMLNYDYVSLRYIYEMCPSLPSIRYGDVPYLFFSVLCSSSYVNEKVSFSWISYAISLFTISIKIMCRFSVLSLTDFTVQCAVHDVYCCFCELVAFCLSRVWCGSVLH